MLTLSNDRHTLMITATPIRKSKVLQSKQLFENKMLHLRPGLMTALSGC